MVNPFRDIDWRPDVPARRRFGRSLVFGFPIVAAVLSVALRISAGSWEMWPWWLAAAAMGVGFLCWVVPAAAWPFYVVWHAAGATVGIVVSNVLLAASYVLTVVPIGLVMRAVGRDPMQRKFDPQAATYWRPADNPIEPERYFRQF